MARQRWTKGAVLEVPLSSGVLVKAQMLKEPEFAFFHPEDEDLLLFRLWVHKSAYNTGRWTKIGKAAIRQDLTRQVDRFKQDPISGQLSIYRDEIDLPATVSDCEGLERAAVWDPHHVESRLEDELAGRPNKWVESLKMDPDRL